MRPTAGTIFLLSLLALSVAPSELVALDDWSRFAIDVDVEGEPAPNASSEARSRSGLGAETDAQTGTNKTTAAPSSGLPPDFKIWPRPLHRRGRIWSFGMGGNRYSLKSGGEDEIIGNGVDVAFGTGWLHQHWYSLGALTIRLGPYNTVREEQLNATFTGTGLDWWWGYSAQDLDLRHESGGYGFALGLRFVDLTGRSIGRNRKESGQPNSPDNLGLVSDLTLRTSLLTISPGLFFCWLKPARPYGNSPEALMTRTEGYLLTITFDLPIIARYRARFVERLEDESSGAVIDGHSNSSGSLKGYAISIGLTSLFGT